MPLPEASRTPPTTGSGVKPPLPEPRCPHCGHWLSTRYSASQPHQCVTVGVPVELARLVVQPTPALRAAVAAAASHRTKLEPVRDQAAKGGPPADPGFARTAASPAHALKRAARYAGTLARQSAPATPPRPWQPIAAAWVLGCLSGWLVALAVWALH